VFEPTHQLFTSVHVKHTMLCIRDVIKKYSECLNKKKFITVKDTLPLIPLTLNTLIPSFLPLLKQFRKSCFVSVFTCAVVLPHCPELIQKGLPFMVILTLGKSQKLHSARSGE
jgi:hypothetical protein